MSNRLDLTESVSICFQMLKDFVMLDSTPESLESVKKNVSLSSTRASIIKPCVLTPFKYTRRQTIFNAAGPPFPSYELQL